MGETQMLIQCLWCLNCWDIDHDPDSCTCDTDADWTLIVVDVPGDEMPYPAWMERSPDE